MVQTIKFTLSHIVGPRIDTKWRLQHAGSDLTLYANNEFSIEKGSTPLLDAILSHLRRNDAGVDTVRVTPYTIECVGSWAFSREDFEQLFTQACLEQGLKPERVDKY